MRANELSRAGAKVRDNPLQAVRALEARLRRQEELFEKLIRITERINLGVTLEEVLDFLYDEMRQVIPYNRIGFALIEQQRGVAVASWSRSDRPMHLRSGFRGRLEGSTLARIIETTKPRILNDLEAYLAEKPNSHATKLIVKEGMLSSLTCPLIVRGETVGFIFFSSACKNTYSGVHVEFFQHIAGLLATIVEKSRLHTELAKQKAAVEKQILMMTKELEVARHVQRALIPQKPPRTPGLEIAFQYKPVIQIGGDIFDIIPLPDGRVLLFVADAMGHGVQAALVISVVKTALRSAVEQDPHPARVLDSVNHVLSQFFNDRFVTAACCLADPNSVSAEVALAGHAGPIWFRADSEDVSQTVGPGFPLGIAADSSYHAMSIDVKLGDILVFTTDGLVEAFDPAGSLYGNKRLMSQVGRHGRRGVDYLCTAVQNDLKNHCGHRPSDDDQTMLVVKFTGNHSTEDKDA